MTDDVSRREAITVIAGISASRLLGGSTARPQSSGRVTEWPSSRVAGRLKQSVSRWCYGRIPLDDLCEAAKSIGYSSVELLSEPDWATPKKHGGARHRIE